MRQPKPAEEPERKIADLPQLEPRHPVQDTEADRLYATLNKLMAETPMADEEKIVVFWTKLVEQLAAIDNDSQRERYVKKMAKLLNQDIVGAARIAFAEF